VLLDRKYQGFIADRIRIYTKLPGRYQGLSLIESDRSWRNRIVSMFVEFTVLFATLLGLLMGGCSIYWVKAHPHTSHARWGRRLFVVTLLTLGGTALFGAISHADGLAPLGLLSGLLTVGMLWEGSAPVLQDDTSRM
jgi:hypothetical protein